MTLQDLLYIFAAIIVFSNGQHLYKQSNDCPGNLQWSKTGTTILGKSYGLSPVNELNYPTGIFIEPKTQILYVADAANNRIQKRYPNGEVVTAAGQANGTAGSTDDKLASPLYVFADENENVYVADWNNQRIQFWSSNATTGKTLAGNRTRGPALNEFDYPSVILVNSKRNLIVADMQNQRVTQWPFSFDPKTSIGTIIAGGNNAGISPDQLYNPMGLYYDEPNGTLYISNNQGHSITQWILGDRGYQNIYAGIPGRAGNNSGQLSNPQGITLDKYGNLYIADSLNHRIQLFCPNAVFGITIAGTGQRGESSFELNEPADVALDSQLNLYVSDFYNNRIQKFERIQ